MHTTISTFKVLSIGPEQSGQSVFEVPSRLETSMGVLAVSRVVAAGTTVDLSGLLVEDINSGLTPKAKEVGTIALQGDNPFDISLYFNGVSDVFSGCEGLIFVRAVDGTVHHIKVKAGAADVALSGLITTGVV